MTEIFGGVRNFSPAIAGSPFGSANRRICGSLTLAQISQGETSHTPRTLSEIVGRLGGV